VLRRLGWCRPRKCSSVTRALAKALMLSAKMRSDRMKETNDSLIFRRMGAVIVSANGGWLQGVLVESDECFAC